MASPCPECASSVEESALTCAHCGWLRHRVELEDLARRARQSAQSGDYPGARDLWMRALALLPSDTAQYRTIQSRIGGLATRTATKRTGWKKTAVGAVSAGLVLLSKAKLLLLGLTKIGTLLSMFAFFGVYWSLYGWAFALGLVVAIYVHEMGHVSRLRSYGIPASAPMFIPGFGAFISVRGMIFSAVQDARVGLAGPVYGLGITLFFLGAAYAGGSKTMAAIAHASAVINIFNLIPVWQLDGSRGLRSLDRAQRGMLLALTLAMFAITSERMLLLVALGMAYRLFTKDQGGGTDKPGLLEYAALLIALPATVAAAKALAVLAP